MDEKLVKYFDIIKAIKKTNNVLVKLENDLVRNYNLTSSQYGVLECLYVNGDMCINELIGLQMSSSGTMTVIVKNLIKMGYVNKENTCNDKRFFKVILSEEGKKLVLQILPGRKKILNDFIDTISKKEQDILLKILYKFNNKYQEEKNE